VQDLKTAENALDEVLLAEVAPLDQKLGVSLVPADDTLRTQLDLPKEGGLVVTGVEPSSRADTLGIKRNDILLSLDDNALGKVEDLEANLAKNQDRALKLKLIREGKPETIEIPPKGWLADALLGVEMVPEYWIGIPVAPVGDALRSHIRLSKGLGLVATAVIADSPAAKAGVQANDVLVKLGDKPLTTVEDLVAKIQENKDEPTTLEVIRGGMPRTLKITPQKRKLQERREVLNLRGSPPHVVRWARPGVIVTEDGKKQLQYRFTQPPNWNMEVLPVPRAAQVQALERLRAAQHSQLVGSPVEHRLMEINQKLEDLRKSIEEIKAAVKK
jgi:membrane-associated protease RseP (regulator of RpoE activity)